LHWISAEPPVRNLLGGAIVAPLQDPQDPPLLTGVTHLIDRHKRECGKPTSLVPWTRSATCGRPPAASRSSTRTNERRARGRRVGSQQALDAFAGTHLMPAFQRHNFPPPNLDVYPLHSLNVYRSAERYMLK
jgi:hypothetical protein